MPKDYFFTTSPDCPSSGVSKINRKLFSVKKYCDFICSLLYPKEKKINADVLPQFFQILYDFFLKICDSHRSAVKNTVL